MTPRTVAVAGLLLLSLGPLPLLGASGLAVQARLSADLAAGKPVVVHLLVALCDNEHQGIVPVPEHLGNGQQPTSGRLELQAGGAAHMVAFVGHNGLMDFSLVDSQGSLRTAPARSAVVLACASKPYFLQTLQAAGAHALLLTTGFMAPEAYTLDAVIRSWVAGAESSDAREAAASAYHAYQKCGLGGARKLFWSEE